jgi:hypothetical protein
LFPEGAGSNKKWSAKVGAPIHEGQLPGAYWTKRDKLFISPDKKIVYHSIPGALVPDIWIRHDLGLLDALVACDDLALLFGK